VKCHNVRVAGSTTSRSHDQNRSCKTRSFTVNKPRLRCSLERRLVPWRSPYSHHLYSEKSLGKRPLRKLRRCAQLGFIRCSDGEYDRLDTALMTPPIEWLRRWAGSAIRVHQAEGRRGDDGLLHRNLCVVERKVEAGFSPAGVAKRTGGEAGHAAGVPCRERNFEAVGVGVGKPVNGVRPKVVVFALFAIGDDGRPRRLEAGDGVADGILKEH